MSELPLPCPFCGGQAHQVSDYSSERDSTFYSIWHMCPQGGDYHPYGTGTGRMSVETAWFKSPDMAIAAWNGRRESWEGQ